MYYHKQYPIVVNIYLRAQISVTSLFIGLFGYIKKIHLTNSIELHAKTNKQIKRKENTILIEKYFEFQYTANLCQSG